MFPGPHEAMTTPNDVREYKRFPCSGIADDYDKEAL
jgi:hypothetical protein